MTLVALMLPWGAKAQNVSVWNGSAEIWTQGQGTESSPYLIENAQQLAYIAEMVNGGVTHYDGTYFKLTTDVYIDSITVWQPIGLNYTYYFGGHFDGDNHSVTLYLTTSTMQFVGIFGYAKNGSFQNLTSAGRVTRTSSSSHAYVGGICGSSTSSFTNCQNYADISSTSFKSSTSSSVLFYSRAGGICGYTTAAVTNCYNTGDITSYCYNKSGYSPEAYSGGIVGYSTATVTNCHNIGNIFSYANGSSSMGIYKSSSYSGGICGYSTAAVTYCHNTGDISSTSSFNHAYYSYSGGICGYTTATVNHCYNTANVISSGLSSTSSSGHSNGGGICGFSNHSTITNCYNTGDISSMMPNNAYAGGICGYGTETSYTIKNCYNVGSLLSGTDRGGISGYSGTITNCHYLNTCGHTASTGGTAKTEAQMKSSSFPVILNTDSTVFVIDAIPNINQGYPIFSDWIYVTTIDATEITFTKAKMNGSYTGTADVVGFEYKPSTVNNFTTVYANVGTPASYQLNNLQSGTEYTFRFFVQIDGVTYTGQPQLFTTQACDLQVIINKSASEICDGGSDTLTATGNSNYSNAFTYEWNNGSTDTSIIVTNDASYSIIVHDTNGCSATASASVTVNPLPQGSISGNTTLCAGQNTTLIASGANSYHWSTGATAPVITVNSSGDYICTFTNIYGCTSTQTVTVNVFSEPIITGSTNFCSGGYTTLTATGGDSYQWSTGATSATINVNTAGNYSVTASTENGCSGSSSVNVVENQPVNVTITGNPVICNEAGTTLTATSGASYMWSSGETTQSINVNNPGSYSVTVMNANGCSGSSSQTVTMMEPAVITGNTNICEGETAILSVSGAGTYTWSNGAHTSSITVRTPGTYTVTASLPNGCSSTASAEVTVATAPTPTILGNTTLCQGETTTLTANGGVSYTWSNTTTNNSISVSQSGVYTVTATNAEGCSATANVTVNVNPLPNVNIIGNNSFCQGDNVTLTATGASTYAWSNTSTNAAITVSGAGIYMVTGTDANGCSNTATKAVFVNPTYNTPLTHSMCEGESYNFYGQNITAAGTYTHTLQTVNGCDSVLILVVTLEALPPTTITGNTTICEGETTTLIANGGVSYAWSNGGATNSINVMQSGIYTVTATNAEGCSNTANVTVNVNPLPNVNIIGNNSFCQGDNVTLTATGANMYAWSNASTDAAITVSSAGNYTVTGTDVNGCSNIATKTVTVNPTYNVALTHSMCEGESYNFYGQNLTTVGTYTHTLQTINGCDSVLTLTLTMKALPTPYISGNMTLCEGESTMLTANGGISYNWSNGSATNSINVAESGVYTVTATNVEGCTATASATVTVNPLPIVVIGGNTSICEGGNTTLTASGADTYSWSTGENTASVNISTFGIYTVTGTSVEGCSNTSEVTVLVLQLPIITISGETDICAGESTILTANGGETYLWSNGNTDAALTVSTAGTYQVIGYNEAGCNAMASATVNVWQPATTEFSIECPDTCYTWNGESYCQSGDYTQTLQTDHGCDSIVTLHLTITVGIDDFDGFDFKVYPNPTNSVINVQCTMNNVQFDNLEVQIVDVYGKLLQIRSFDGETSVADLTGYANGVYFIKMVADGKTIAVQKVVKQ